MNNIFPVVNKVWKRYNNSISKNAQIHLIEVK